jgi:hypothetical protein
LRKPNREQMKKICVIGLKLAAGDYFGVAQDLSLRRFSLQKILKVP